MVGLLETLIKPDKDDHPERSKIIDAANLIQVGEFQFIQLAYKAWYKTELPDEKVNAIFSEYMLRNIIPIWVRYYADDIFKLYKANILNTESDKYHIYDHEFGGKIFDQNHRKKLGIIYSIIILITFFFAHFITIKYSQETTDFSLPYIEKEIIDSGTPKKN